MAAWMTIEEESGTSTAWVHPHNGYYAGDFSGLGSQARESGQGGATTLTASVAEGTGGAQLRVW